MRRVTDPNELQRLKKDGFVVTPKSLLAVLVGAFVLGLTVRLAGVPFWPTFIGLLVVVFIATYILGSRAQR